MTLPAAISMTLMLLAAPVMVAAEPQRPAVAPPVASVTQFSIHERIVIRMPIGRHPVDRASPIDWKEKRGPKCIGVGDLGGALIAGPSTVDLVLTGGQRVRAKLDGDCPQLDFYGGFYIKPGADGRVCADRDTIRVRSGASCQIDQFKRLVARR